MYTEMIDGRRQVTREVINHVDVRRLAEELKYQKLGEVLYLLGKTLNNGVLLEVVGDDIIKMGKYEYNFKDKYIRNYSGLNMERLDNMFMVQHLIAKTREEWIKVNNN